jgi:hypothetical protein
LFFLSLSYRYFFLILSPTLFNSVPWNTTETKTAPPEKYKVTLLLLSGSLMAPQLPHAQRSAGKGGTAEKH